MFSQNIMKKNKIRVRFAPSPTGFVHIGSLRTTLYDYLFARKNGGVFVLRVEDTDQKRFVPGAVENLINTFNWAGLNYDEGVFMENGKIVQRGKFGPYFQSERLDIYKQYAEKLLACGWAYKCFCAPERLESMRKKQLQSRDAPMYDRLCCKLSSNDIKEREVRGEKFVIRQKIKLEGETKFRDLVHGWVKFKNELLDDQILMKSDGFPTYNFANVIDDHLMEISHIIRGEEFISSTPKYIQLYQAFDWNIPHFAHLPLLLNPDKTKLSKRQGDVAVEEYVKQGYLKEAIINFVALLGWNPGKGSTQEIFSIQELIDEFDLSRVHKGGAVFDLKKLDWLNAQYIKKLSIDELFELTKNYFKQKDFYIKTSEEKKSQDFLKKILTIERERMKNLSSVGESNKFFFHAIDYDKELLRWRKNTDKETKNYLEKSKKVLENISEVEWTKENLEKVLLEAASDRRGDLLWPMRVALTGEQKSPGPFEVAWVLGKKESLKRLTEAINKV